MTYTALPDRRMPYDNDGTVYALGGTYVGVLDYPTGGEALIANGYPQDLAFGGGSTAGLVGQPSENGCFFMFFPEQREVTAFYSWGRVARVGISTIDSTCTTIKGSNDTTNGLDGTFETASLGGSPTNATRYDWRSTIKTVSFTGPKKVIRGEYSTPSSAGNIYIAAIHIYGEKAGGQTPDDLIFINHDDTPNVEYAAPEDFGDQPLATTVVRQFRVKNTSATKTANTINIQCNDADFAISTDSVTWVATINIASLSAGAESSTMYVRCTTPSPGALLGPRFARIIATVASYT